MSHDRSKTLFRQRVDDAVDELLAAELRTIRRPLLSQAMDVALSLAEYIETAIQFWRGRLNVDRIFIVDMSDGRVVAGWNKGKNIIKLQDWDPHYIPLEDDVTLQLALESDEPIAAPADGEGADLAFSIRFDEKQHWLVVFDQTNVARVFSPAEIASVSLVRDLILLKHRLRATEPPG